MGHWNINEASRLALAHAGESFLGNGDIVRAAGVPYEQYKRPAIQIFRRESDIYPWQFRNFICLADRSRKVRPLRLNNRTPFSALRLPNLVSEGFARIVGIPATATVEAVIVHDVALQSPAVPTLSHKWRDIQGANDWKDLLDPLDLVLKTEIIKYGEFAQLCYDAFDYDYHSDFCGSCKYNPKKLLKEHGLRHEDYEVTKYLYATSAVSLPASFRRSDSDDPWSKDSNWIGFVAVSTSDREIERLGRRDIVVAWRGTVTKLDWLTDLQNSLCPASLDQRSVGRSTDADVRVETGFLSLYTTKKPTARYNKKSAREQLLSEIKRLLELYKGEEISISLTGHSLGAALALLSGYDLAESGLNIRSKISSHSTFNSGESMSLENIFQKTGSELQHHEIAEVDKIPITVFSFAGPRVGNNAFRDRLNTLGVKVLRIVNVNDLVTKVPGVLLNEKFQLLHDFIEKLPWTYSHGGVELTIDNHHSPYLKRSMDPSDFHNLEAYLHLIDGHNGSGRKFSRILSRDPALVNKNSDFLRKHFKIPGFWRQDRDKGLVKHTDGRLRYRGRDPEDIPPYVSDAAK